MLIIPDIHQDHKRADDIIARHPEEDKVLFLGDYLDSFKEPYTCASTVEWLKKRMDEHPEDIFLLGNHDVHYVFPLIERYTQCSGFSLHKNVETNPLKISPYHKMFKLLHKEGKFLFSHAGLLDVFRCPAGDEAFPESWVDYINFKMYTNATVGAYDPFLAAGKDRGGSSEIGGATWLDWSSFVPVEGVNQVVGHYGG